MSRYFLVLLLIFYARAGAQSSALAIADSLYAVGNYGSAIRTLNTLSPETSAISVRLAKNYEAKQDYKESKRFYERVLKIEQDQIVLTLDYADLLRKSGELMKADSVYTALVQRFPRNPGFHYRRGLVKEELKDSTASDDFFLTALLDPTHQQALYKISKEYLSKGRLLASEKYSKQGLSAYPENPALLSILAQTYYHQQRYELAIAEFQKLLELGKGTEFVYSTLGMSYYYLHNFEESITHFLQALEFDENNPFYHLNLGKLYARTGDLTRSETHLLAAIILKTPILDAEYLSLALTYNQMEDHKKALKYLNSALQENPDNERALYEKAIAADNYYKDLETRINYYDAYLEKYEKAGNPQMLLLARQRKQDLIEELHLSR